MKITVICDVLGQPNNGTTIATLNLIRYLPVSYTHLDEAIPSPKRVVLSVLYKTFPSAIIMRRTELEPI